MSRVNTFSTSVNTINMKVFLTHGGIYASLRENSTSTMERDKALRSLEI